MQRSGSRQNSSVQLYGRLRRRRDCSVVMTVLQLQGRRSRHSLTDRASYTQGELNLGIYAARVKFSESFRGNACSGRIGKHTTVCTRQTPCEGKP